MKQFLLIISIFCVLQITAFASVSIKVITDQAEAVLSILKKKKANKTITDRDWQKLFSSEGYVRLKKRQESFNRPFEEADFKTFVLSDELVARTELLEKTLMNWKKADTLKAAERALKYLPEGSQIKAKIYPVIKPTDNSFVFEVKTDPAIFLYLDPAVSKEKFENTLAHELHHIGYGGSCPSAQTKEEISKLPENTQNAIGWSGAFGEGLAMLAAAGSPDIHPHAVSSAEERERWDRDLANFNEDLRKIEKFLLDVANGKLNEEEAGKVGFSFFGTQGPWYTVGWKMAVLIEKTYGRGRLIECICDQRKLLPTYNEAAAKHNKSAKEKLNLWSESLVEKIKTTGETRSIQKNDNEKLYDPKLSDGQKLRQ